MTTAASLSLFYIFENDLKAFKVSEISKQLACFKLDMLFIKTISELRSRKMKPNEKKMTQCLSLCLTGFQVSFQTQ